ncbi:hypothetical protein ACEN5R_04850 [Streptococcus pyogenes]|uniref:hypothetical protein n=1 Tax=Streptococcus pyogenes TaxID=1314 RepID=UPI00052A8F57|nr:hypothetical protein [Streptococcus pyogenes]AIW11290.1 hypothetical protein STAB904_02195 [Streptococcus pyogenes]OAC81512.1 hypothetical protein AWU12_00035 [Streptococcus pyogenes]OAC83105.1 hypothetical protein AWU13_04010 [Streptococcus pyogenes]OAC85124.1 hypothetical protein AWU14_03705 [Streptococcus pyogenes]OAC88618.1 hypothetical protein AWU15_03920 [Streptococcus pyogenes]
MKKTLTLLLALFAIGVTSSVRAEDAIKWKLDPETSQNSPIVVNIDNGNKLRFTLPTGWSVSFKRKKDHYNPLEVNNKPVEVNNKPVSETKNRNTSPRIVDYGKNGNPILAIYNDNQGSSGLPITVTVDKPNEGDELTLLYRADDGFFGGFTKLKDSKTLEKEKKEKERQLAEEKQIEEERKHVEQKQLEENMLKQIREEDHKPWHQRLSESIQDQWWNFKGLFQ